MLAFGTFRFIRYIQINRYIRPFLWYILHVELYGRSNYYLKELIELYNLISLKFNFTYIVSSYKQFFLKHIPWNCGYFLFNVYTNHFVFDQKIGYYLFLLQFLYALNNLWPYVIDLLANNCSIIMHIHFFLNKITTTSKDIHNELNNDFISLNQL